MTASTLARLRTLDAQPLKVMACHLSPEDKPFACRGFLAVHGEEKPGVRLALMMGFVDPPPYTCEAELVSTTAAMLHNAEQQL